MPLQGLYGCDDAMQHGHGAGKLKLVVLPVNRVLTQQVPDANIMDHASRW